MFSSIRSMFIGMFSSNNKPGMNQIQQASFHSDIWEDAYAKYLKRRITEHQCEEAVTILNNQYIFFNAHFDLTRDEEIVLATLCSLILRNLITWDVCSVQTLARSMGMVSVNRPDSYGVHNVDVSTIRHKLDCMVKHLDSHPSSSDLEITAIDIANQINNGVLNIMFHGMSIQHNVSPTPHALQDYIDRVDDDCNQQPNWFISSHETHRKFMLPPAYMIKRRGRLVVLYIEMPHGQKIKWIITNDITWKKRVGMGYSGGEGNVVSPLIFAQHLILDIEGPIVLHDETVGYYTNSHFCCVESVDRKRMIRQFTIK